jgi:hypothetical protein
MSYTAEVKRNRKYRYACSNMSWHLMWKEIHAAVSEEYKPVIADIQKEPNDTRHVNRRVCPKVVAALESLPEDGAGDFSAPCTIADLLIVFRAAVEMKSSVYIW